MSTCCESKDIWDGCLAAHQVDGAGAAAIGEVESSEAAAAARVGAIQATLGPVALHHNTVHQCVHPASPTRPCGARPHHSAQ